MKKRILSFFLVICFALTAMPVSLVFANGTDTISVYATADKTEVVPGDTLTVAIKTENLTVDGSAATRGFQFRFNYDSSVLEYIDYEYGDVLRKGYSKSVSARDGFIGISAAYADKFTALSGDLVVLTFDVIGTVSETIDFSFSNALGVISAEFDSVPEVTVQGEAIPTLTVNADKTRVQRTEEITYSFDISEIADFKGIQFEFDYDETKLEYVEGELSAAFQDGQGGVNESEGKGIVLAISEDTASYSGNICTMTFRVKTSAANGALVNTVADIKIPGEATTVIDVNVDYDTVEVYGENTYAKLSVTADETVAKRGEEITFSFDLSETADFNGIEFDFDYDETKLTFVEAVVGNVITDATTGGINDENGMVTVICAYADPFDFAGNICTMTFVVNDDTVAGETVVELLDLKSDCDITADETEFVITIKSQGVLTVAADRAGVTRGSEVTYAIAMSEVSDFSGIQFDFDYDETKLTYVGYESGSVFDEAFLADINDEGGMITAMIAYDEEGSCEGEICVLTFTVNDEAEAGIIDAEVSSITSYTDFSVTYPVQAYVPDKSEVSVVADKTQANVNDLITYTVNLSETLQYQGIQFDFDYDESKLEFVSSEPGDVFSNAFQCGIRDVDGVVIVIAANETPIDIPDSSVCELTFKVKALAEDVAPDAAYGETTVNFTEMKPAGFEVETNVEDAVVNLGSVLDVTTNTTEVTSGQDVVYSIDIAPACNFNGMEFIFGFDPEVFEFVECVNGEAFDGSIGGVNDEFAPGQVKFVLAKDEVFEGNVCTIRLRTKADVMYGEVNNTISELKTPCIMKIGTVNNVLTIVPSEEDTQAANAVIDLINEIGTVTLDSETKIVAAEEAFDALTEPRKTLVTNAEALTEARATYNQMVADKAAADVVVAKIDAIGDVSLASGAAIEEAERAYETLTDAQKAYVTNYETLTAARATYNSLLQDQAAADNVMNLINEIGTVTLDSEAKITMAEEAYEELSDAQKALVTNEVTLTTARAAYDKLVADKAAADAVIAKINAIGTVTLESGNAVAEAESALAALTDEQKALVTNEAALTTARVAYDKLVADKAAADAVIAKIDAIGTVTLESGTAIIDAETAFATLTDEQKALVTNEATLTAARTAYDKLVADKAAVDNVIALIDAIGEVTIDSLEKITAAEIAYNALSDELKAQVTNADKIAEAKAIQAAQKQAVDDVIALINAIAEPITKESLQAIEAAETAFGALSDAQKAHVTNKDDLTAKRAAYDAIKTITFDYNYSNKEPSLEYVNVGETIEKPTDPKRSGYTFKGWYADEDLKDAWDFDEDIVEVDTVLYAKWSKNSGGGRDTVGGGRGTGSSGLNVIVPAATPEPTATPEPSTGNDKPVTGGNFSDVIEHWAKDSVNSLYQAGIVQGESDTIFNPDREITRAEFSAMIYRLVKPAELTTNNFSDVNEGDWYNTAISSLAELGFLKGYGDDTFKPNNLISRQEMAVIVSRVFAYMGKTEPALEGLDRFADSEDIALWAQEAVDMLASAKIINGYEDSTFKPLNNTSRAHAAKVIESLMNLA